MLGASVPGPPGCRDPASGRIPGMRVAVDGWMARVGVWRVGVGAGMGRSKRGGGMKCRRLSKF